MDLNQLAKDLLRTKPEVIEHLRVWAGLEDAFACSDIERQDVLDTAQSLGLVKAEPFPVLTPDGARIIFLAQEIINDLA